ncbi:MAG: hypothetical protein ACI92S_003630, partial [Planctomycetaceae bacterium]
TYDSSVNPFNNKKNARSTESRIHHPQHEIQVETGIRTRC